MRCKVPSTAAQVYSAALNLFPIQLRVPLGVHVLVCPGWAAQESKRNTIKDFLQVAGPLGVTNFLVFSASELAPYIRIARTPRGPTLTFKIGEYSLAADVANAQAKPRVPPNIFETPPLVCTISLGFSGSPTARDQFRTGRASQK